MSFSYTVKIVDPLGIVDDAALAADALAALGAWGAVLSGGGSVDLEIDLNGAGNTSGRAGGAPGAVFQLGLDGAHFVEEAAATRELQVGSDVNGVGPDIIIGIDDTYARSLFFSLNPGAAIPSDKTDGLSVLMHEIGHGLGISGYTDPVTGILPATLESPWDRLLSRSGGAVFFNGPAASALYGGPVPVTADDTFGEADFHVGNHITDPLVGQDLMNGVSFKLGVRYPIDLLDIAMENDVGNPLSFLGEIELSYGILAREPTLSIFSAADLSALTTLSDRTVTGAITIADAIKAVVAMVASTSEVATLAYEFFTGKAPSAAGMDFLVSPDGPNPNNLNAAYYQSFSLENRYINFAVNLGKVGEGEAAFNAKYGGLSLFEATRTAYATIFGEAPSDAKLHAILDPTTVLNGQTFTRSDYFAYYGGDGPNGLGTKAAMVGYLLAEAEKADVGVYAKSNDAFLTDVALHNAPFGVDLVGVYNQPGFVFHPGP